MLSRIWEKTAERTAEKNARKRTAHAHTNASTRHKAQNVPKIARKRAGEVFARLGVKRAKNALKRAERKARKNQHNRRTKQKRHTVKRAAVRSSCFFNCHIMPPLALCDDCQISRACGVRCCRDFPVFQVKQQARQVCASCLYAVNIYHVFLLPATVGGLPLFHLLFL